MYYSTTKKLGSKNKKKIFAEGLAWPSAKGIFAEGLANGPRQRNFFKKIKNLCRVPGGLALGKEIFLKKIKALCRAPHGLALGKEIF